MNSDIGNPDDLIQMRTSTTPKSNGTAMKGPFNQKENHQVQNFQSNNQEIDRNKLTPKDFDQRARETQGTGSNFSSKYYGDGDSENNEYGQLQAQDRKANQNKLSPLERKGKAPFSHQKESSKLREFILNQKGKEQKHQTKFEVLVSDQLQSQYGPLTPSTHAPYPQSNSFPQKQLNQKGSERDQGTPFLNEGGTGYFGSQFDSVGFANDDNRFSHSGDQAFSVAQARNWASRGEKPSIYNPNGDYILAENIQEENNSRVRTKREFDAHIEDLSRREENIQNFRGKYPGSQANFGSREPALDDTVLEDDLAETVLETQLTNRKEEEETQNDIPTKGGENDMKVVWRDALRLLANEELEKAFDRVLNVSDDIYLIRLMAKVGVNLKKLTKGTSIRVIERLVNITRSHFFQKLALDFIEEGLECGVVHQVSLGDQDLLMKSLEEMSGFSGSCGFRAAEIYGKLEEVLNGSQGNFEDSI